MAKRTRNISWIAGLVYFSQGALGVSGIALLLHLRELNWSVGQITTVMSVAAVPWVLKVLYGIVSDTLPLFGYRRKSYLVLCLLLTASGWFGLTILPQEKFWIFVAMLAANLGFAAT
ncbi:MAG: hypothetical protein NC930_03640, partial [Candidatus Omnitrophica bacterium]|nr:hypothetical protein [Candidatus Omnitrophota bacterium]